jgi:DMSO/TMAO reductase YedYZ molybdopterin-dependent catalytic subunit
MLPKQNFLLVLLLNGLVLSLTLLNPIVTVHATHNASNGFEEVEIQEYEGQDLSSISLFIENSIKGPQYIDNETYKLKITGLVNNEIEHTYNDVISNYQNFKKVVTLYCVEGWNATILWEGVLIKELLQTAEVSQQANTVIFYAYDGYSTSIPLEYILDKNILMAYKMNNVTLPPERGYPFQLVAESKWGYKWIKWITVIELSSNEEYRGYWELRGFSNQGDLNESFYDEYWDPSVDDPRFPSLPAGDVPEFSPILFIPILITITIIATLFRKKYLETQKL